MRLIDAEPIEKYIEDGLNCKDPKKQFGHDAIEILTEIHYAPTIAPQPNDPLTLEELREMDDFDVWVTFPPDLNGDRLVMHALVEYDSESGDVWLTNNLGGRSTFDEVSEDGGIAYRRKPEEAPTSSDEGPGPQRATESWKDFLMTRFERKEGPA